MSEKSSTGFTPGEVAIIRELAEVKGEVAHLRADMNRGSQRFGDHEMRIRDLEAALLAAQATIRLIKGVIALGAAVMVPFIGWVLSHLHWV